MHRHGYQGRKFGRERDQRRALLKGLAVSLIERGKIKTTLPKAKELVPFVEALITKAKIGDLHNRRQVIAALSSTTQGHRLVDEIAPSLKARTSGHLRITTASTLRVGDGAQTATVSFVDEIVAQPAAAAPAKPAIAAKATPKAAEPTEAAKETK